VPGCGERRAEMAADETAGTCDEDAHRCRLSCPARRSS
jgi:hypothetical protein